MTTLVLHIPETDSTPPSCIKFDRWLGVGLDALVIAIVDALAESILDRMASPTTIASAARVVHGRFLPWLVARPRKKSREFRLDEIDGELIGEFVADLKRDCAYTTACAVYFGVAFVLRQLSALGMIRGISAILPRNAFPNAGSSGTPTTPYSNEERRVLFIALAGDYREIAEGRYGNEPEEQTYAIVICLLMIAFLTGLNLAPLVSLSRRALQRHPLRADGYTLVGFKRRGNKEVPVPLKAILGVRNPSFDVPGILEVAMRLTEGMLPKIPKKYQDFVFLRYERAGHGWKAVKLYANTACRVAGVLSERYAVVDEEGKPLRIQTRRIRSSLASRVAELSNFDPLVVATVLNNEVKTAGSHYMTPDLDAPADFMRALEAFAERLSNNRGKRSVDTPVGKCSDPLHGRFAPKDGVTFCHRWLSCFRCPNQCVTGGADQLWRMYSFYWILQASRQTLQRSPASGLARFVIRVLDTIMIERYGDVAIKARERARREPHPFWNRVRTLELLDLEVADAKPENS